MKEEPRGASLCTETWLALSWPGQGSAVEEVEWKEGMRGQLQGMRLPFAPAPALALLVSPLPPSTLVSSVPLPALLS